MLQIQTQWQGMSTRRYCSIINNVTRLSDLVEDYHTSLVSKYQSSNDADTLRHWQSLDDTIQTLVSELQQLAIVATDYLCRHIIDRLETPDSIITSIGTRSWEEDSSNNVAEETIGSLQEYFTTIEEWLSSADYFLPKISRECFI